MADAPPAARPAQGWDFLNNPPKAKTQLRVDGLHLTDGENARINDLFRACFATPSGQLVLAHLKRISTNMVMGPGATDGALRHLEGQRYLCAIIQNRARGEA